MHLSGETWGILVGVGIFVVHRLLRPRTRPPQRPTAAARAGQVGEHRATRTLRQYGLTVWPDVRIAIGRRTSQCDQIVVGSFGLVVLETKHWTGELTRHGDQWSQCKADGTRRSYASPEGQNTYHCQVVRQVLKAHGLGRVPIYGAIVLSNPHARFMSKPGSQPIGTPEQMATWIQRLPAGRAFDAAKVERVLRSSGAGVARTTPWG